MSEDFELDTADLKRRMDGAMAALRQEFASLRTGRASAGMLVKRTGAMANLISKQAPDDLITAFARYNFENPDSKLVGGHFFAFGGVAKTAQWANQVVAGQFEMNKDGTGFKV